MGNQISKLEDLEVGEPIPMPAGSHNTWSAVYLAQYREKHPASLFVWNLSELPNVSVEALKNGFNYLKQLRHPAVLKCFDYVISDAEICLVTERVVPLSLHLENEIESVEILSGLRTVADSLSFLHEVAHISHNNVGSHSIFVCPDGSWRLGGFELCTTEPELILQKGSARSHSKSSDISSFAEMIDTLVPYSEDETRVKLEDIRLQIHANHMSFFNIAHSLQLKNEVCSIYDFIKCIPMKTEAEKDQFFRSLPTRLRKLPAVVCGRRLTQLLLSRFLLLEQMANVHFLPHFLTPLQSVSDDSQQGVLPLAVFQKYVIPELVKIFLVHEASVRIALLNHFDRFCGAFETVILSKVILPEVLLGMKDLNNEVVVATFHALANLVPLLGAEAVTGHSHRRIFSDGTPKNKVKIKSHVAPVPIELHDIGAQHEIKPNETTLDSLDIKRSSQNYGLNGDVPRAKKQSHPDEESNVTEQPIRRESPVQMIIDDSEIVVENPDHSDVEWDGWETSENPSVSNWNENVSHASDLTLTTPQMLGIVNTQETSGAIPRKKSLGEEFEIKVVTASVSNLGSEPDYFADMQPIVPKKSDWLTQMASSVSSTTASARNSTDNKFKVFVDAEEPAAEWDVE